MGFLWIEQCEISFEEIKNNNIPLVGLSSYASACYDFCHQWMNGLEYVEIKTSGSTGVPKCIKLSRRQLTASAHKTINFFALEKNDTLLCCLDIQYIAGKMMLIRAMECGANIVCVWPTSYIFRDVPASITITFTALVPMQLHTSLEANNTDWLKKINWMKGILVGGAPVRSELERLCKRITAPVYESYGMTETCSHIALRKINQPEASEWFTILNGITISQNEKKCLVIHGDVTNHQTLVTNDIVEIYDTKKFKWLGRYDNIINSGGIKILPEKLEKEIEKIFHESGISCRFFVAGIPHEKLGTAVCLFIEEPLQMKDDKIYALLQQKISRFEIPKSIIRKNKFYETATGKIDRANTVQGI
jgi:O-succinylbenzoic acid--CoA ligase